MGERSRESELSATSTRHSDLTQIFHPPPPQPTYLLSPCSRTPRPSPHPHQMPPHPEGDHCNTTSTRRSHHSGSFRLHGFVCLSEVFPAHGVTHLQYAYDTMIMVEGSKLDTSSISSSFFFALRPCRASRSNTIRASLWSWIICKRISDTSPTYL